MTNDQIFITSVNKAVNRAKQTGNFNLTILNIFEMLNYYIDYTNTLINLGASSLRDENRQLKEMLNKLRYKYPSVICNYKRILPGSPITPTENTAPTIDDNTINMGTSTYYRFTVADFIVNFSDAQGHSWKNLIVNPENLAYGNLIIRGPVFGTPNPDYPTNPIVLSTTYLLDIEGLVPSTELDLWYLRDSVLEDNDDGFTFRVSDDPMNFLYSTITDMTMSSTEDTSVNQPPADIGDNTIYTDNRAVTVLSLFMFTGGLSAPYSDPEGDLIDAIQIIDISNANRGTFYLSGVEITDGLIITREQIEAGLFTHEGPDQDAISSDVFEFRARDEGSQTWVE